MKISAIVMAAGMSRRMQQDKLHLKLNNRPIYEYILHTLNKYSFHEVLVVAKDEDILKKAERFGFKGINNPHYLRGKSESIKAALKNSQKTDGYMFFVADQPFIKLKTIKKLCAKFHDNPSCIVLPYYNRVPGNPVIFPYSLKEELLQLENDQGGKVVINNNRNKIIGVHILTNSEYLDIDTFADFEKARAILQSKKN